MRIPRGLTSKDFSDALKQFAEAVGKEWVFSSDEDVNLYRAGVPGHDHGFLIGRRAGRGSIGGEV